MPLLDVQDLTVIFNTGKDKITAVDRISFAIDKGQILGIVGESGSGKTVTALSVMGLLPRPAAKISQGHILYHEGPHPAIDLLSASDKQLRGLRGNRISMVFQEPMSSLNPVHRCGYQVAEAIMQHQRLSRSAVRKKTMDLFEEVRLPNPGSIYHSYPFQLSGGQQQRVMIAMAIAARPALLIADEPTTALDVTIQQTILALLKELQRIHGMAVLFITHDLGVVREIADDVLIMQNGKIVESGSVSSVFIQPRHPYTKGLIACRPRLDVRLKKLPVVADFIDIPTDTLYPGVQKTGISISPQERTLHLEKLYQKDPVLRVINLKTCFPLPKKLLSRTRKYTHAVDDVLFDVYAGETLGLVGESGCGKTTLGRSVLRLIKPTSGQVVYKGKYLLDLSSTEMRAFRKNLQIIFQDPYSALNPRITVGPAIMEPMNVHGIHASPAKRRQQAIDLLQKVGLEERHFHRYPHELSGGQRQRVCIARALAVQPELLICDEPVSSLDVSIQAQVLNLLNDLKKEFNLTYIFISHDLSVVKFMADRIIVMKNGKIVEMAEADELYSHPKDPYTQNLISAIPTPNE